jgi:predicted secreted protein
MILHGRNILLLAGGTAIAAAKSCELNVSADIIKTASPNDGQWENGIAGRKSWRASCSQLVTSIVNGAAMVGTQVTLKMQLSGQIGLPFNGFVDSVTVETGSTSYYDGIVWSRTRHSFLAYYLDDDFQDHYFESWPGALSYNYQNNGKFFYMKNKVYRVNNNDLIQEALQGTAIVKDWKVTATMENLAAGSFQFQGVGALTNPTT